VDFTQPTHMLESCRAHQGVAGVNGHRRHDHPLNQFSLCQVKASGSGYCPLSKGRFDLVTVKRIIMFAVVELLPDAPADLEP
jgi:hypothetical protein